VGQLGEVLGRLSVATQPGQGAGPHQRPVGRCPLRAQRGQWVVQPGVALPGSLPQREAGLHLGQRRRVVAGADVPLTTLLAVGLALEEPVAGHEAAAEVSTWSSVRVSR
jgi:hypothetical protein